MINAASDSAITVARFRPSKLLVWRGYLGGILRDSLGEGNCKSKIAARQWGVNFAARHSDASQGSLTNSASTLGLLQKARTTPGKITCFQLGGYFGNRKMAVFFLKIREITGITAQVGSMK